MLSAKEKRRRETAARSKRLQVDTTTYVITAKGIKSKNSMKILFLTKYGHIRRKVLHFLARRPKSGSGINALAGLTDWDISKAGLKRTLDDMVRDKLLRKS